MRAGTKQGAQFVRQFNFGPDDDSAKGDEDREKELCEGRKKEMSEAERENETRYNISD